MKNRLGTILACSLPVALMLALTPVSRADLLVNGNFAQTNSGGSQTLPPPGWTNIGASDGVIADSNFGTPAYGGSTNYFDTGGYGNALPNSGDGIEQTVATAIGTTYALTFGMSNENYPNYGPEYLNVLVNGSLLNQYLMTYNSAYGGFQLPWTTENLSFTANSASSTIAFTVTGTGLGGQDPLIAGVDLETASAAPTPEPGSFILLGSGLIGLAGAVRRRFIA